MSTKQITGKLALLIWIQKIAIEYGIKVENFTSHFKDGRVLCAIINYYFPDELDFKTIKTDSKEEILNNFKMAFDIAEQKGVVKLLDPEDMLTPDQNSNMLYMAEMNKIFKPLPRGIPSSKKEEVLKDLVSQGQFQNIKDNILLNINNNNVNNTNQSSQLDEKEEKERQEKEKQEKEKKEKEKQEEKERQEKERQEKEKEKQENERQEKERQEKEKQEKERVENERQEKERLEKERQENERQEKERVENERKEKERLEKEEKQNLLRLETQEKERVEKEKQESIEREKSREKTQQPTEVKFHPTMLLIFVYLLLGYFVSGFIVNQILFNIYFYIIFGLLFGISIWRPQFNFFPIIFSLIPYFLLLLSNLDLQLVDVSLFIKSILVSKNLFKVHYYLTNTVSILNSKLILPLQTLLGIQNGGWSLSFFFLPRILYFVLGIFF